MATWPSASKASTANLDSGSDSPRLARADIKDNVDNVNSIIDMFNISSPSDNQILKYNNSNARFELGTESSSGEITFVGDDSTGTAVSLNETFKIAGGTNITTAVSGDTLTVTSSALADVVSDTSPQLGGNLDLNSNTINGTGTISITGDISSDAISLADNKIKSSRSNDNLNLETSGTGQIQLKGSGGEFSNYSTDGRYSNGNLMYQEDLDFTLGSGTRFYRNALITKLKATAGQSDSNNSNDRFRNVSYVEFDLNGNTTNNTSSYISRGPMALSAEVLPTNSSSDDAVLGNATGVQGGMYVTTSNTGNLTISGANSGVATFSSYIDLEANNASSTISVSDAYGYLSKGYSGYGSGTTTLTNLYHFYAGNSPNNPTNEYAFYTNDATMESAIGTLEQYREKINALTYGTTTTVDCDLAPFHTITLTGDTEFNISNLGTGQTVTLKIIQDGNGSRTATFGTDGSVAVKFSGGTPTLSTAASSIDVVTVFNDGTDFIGTIAKAFAA